jgi:GH25 family lysozyme M1 (1,4-beta-N-acetylmuramidase)
MTRLARFTALLVMVVLLALSAAIATAGPVRGPDVSNNNGCGVNWHAIRQAGARFGAAKATEGTAFRDRCFPRNWGHMQHEGLVRIAYDFGRPASWRSGTQEARYFVAWVNANGGFGKHDFAVLDLEALGGPMSQAALRRWVIDWLVEVERAGHPGRMGIYSGAWWWNPHVGIWFPIGPFKWTANYSPAPRPFGAGGWDFWQFTDGRYGPSPHSIGAGSMDISVFSGDYSRLLALSHILQQHAYASRRLKAGSEGTDVRGLQGALKVRLVRHQRHPIPIDGKYGPKTAKAVHDVKYLLGFRKGDVAHRYCSTRCQLYVAHPNKRPASYIPRVRRRHSAAKAGKAAAGPRTSRTPKNARAAAPKKRKAALVSRAKARQTRKRDWTSKFLTELREHMLVSEACGGPGDRRRAERPGPGRRLAGDAQEDREGARQAVDDRSEARSGAEVPTATSRGPGCCPRCSSTSTAGSSRPRAAAGAVPAVGLPARDDRGLEEELRIIFLKARQLGLSWLVLAYALWFCTCNRGQTVIIINRNLREAKDLLRRVRFMWERLPAELRSRSASTRRRSSSSSGSARGSCRSPRRRTPAPATRRSS